jgi:hypothetical protein
VMQLPLKLMSVQTSPSKTGARGTSALWKIEGYESSTSATGGATHRCRADGDNSGEE